VRVYIARNGEKFHPYVNRPICVSNECFVIELTFGDVLQAALDENHPLRAYVPKPVLVSFSQFFDAVKSVTPDHVTPDDKVFVVYEDPSDWRNDTRVYILFDHFEHCDTLDIGKLMLELRNLCERTECDPAGIEEMSCSSEYALLYLNYASLDRYINNTLLRRTNPWRRVRV